MILLSIWAHPTATLLAVVALSTCIEIIMKARPALSTDLSSKIELSTDYELQIIDIAFLTHYTEHG